MFASAIRGALDRIAPSPQPSGQSGAAALRRAYCGLLMEVARIESARPNLKRAAVGQALQSVLTLPREEAAALLVEAERAENRYTSYYEPVTVINRRCPPQAKVGFVEQLWRVAFADGNLDMYEDQLIRKLAELLHVAHADFIVAKQRARDWSRTTFAARAAETAG